MTNTFEMSKHLKSRITLTRARVAVSATFAMVGGAKMTPPP